MASEILVYQQEKEKCMNACRQVLALGPRQLPHRMDVPTFAADQMSAFAHVFTPHSIPVSAEQLMPSSAPRGISQNHSNPCNLAGVQVKNGAGHVILANKRDVVKALKRTDSS